MIAYGMRVTALRQVATNRESQTGTSDGDRPWLCDIILTQYNITI